MRSSVCGWCWYLETDGNMTCSQILPVLLAAISVLPSAASELVVRNANLNLEFLPAAFDYTLTNAGSSRSGSDQFDTAFGIAAGGRYSIAGPGDSHGFIVGGHVFADQASYAGIGHLTDFGARVDGGYGYAFNDTWTTYLMAEAGYGRSTFDITSASTFPAVSLSGSSLRYGVVFGIDLTLVERWLVNGDIGWVKSTSSLSGGGVDLSLNRQGLMAAIGISYRFSTRPRTLE